ncbi:MAG TPA: MiaB/RimO family radical SAM methylthiotransferase, partial [Gemmatimonadales bacterium]|nr:MiaB/RimO family radical SAM methylthiotransferase [Gemmatimonadales bacterium]
GVDVPAGADRVAVNVYFHTFGCKANQYDTERVRAAFEAGGAVVVADPALADLAVINSCTVTHESEVKLRRFVRHVAKSGHAQTIVMGCAAALDDGAIAALPSVRAVVANADPEAVLTAAGLTFPLAATRRGGQGVRSRALLKIQDGCDEHCTFCATTLARGNNRSRAVAELVEEARALAQHHAEIVLTGVHIGTYGQDRSSPLSALRRGGQGVRSLGALLERLIEAVPAVRYRLSSVEATEVDDTLAHLLINAPRNLAAHLHAPLQSGSNRVLKRMGRHWYTAESYRARIEWLAERLPVFGLGADVIAGFPGESDADHHASLTLLHVLPFTYLHVFPFSVRPDAPAARLAGQVRPEVIRERARELRELGEAKAKAYRLRRVGQVADGVVSGRGQGKIEVITEDYLTVYVGSEDWSGESRFAVEIN